MTWEGPQGAQGLAGQRGVSGGHPGLYQRPRKAKVSAAASKQPENKSKLVSSEHA